MPTRAPSIIAASKKATPRFGCFVMLDSLVVKSVSVATDRVKKREATLRSPP